MNTYTKQRGDITVEFRAPNGKRFENGLEAFAFKFPDDPVGSVEILEFQQKGIVVSFIMRQIQISPSDLSVEGLDFVSIQE